MRTLLIIAAATTLAGCGLFSDGVKSCNEPQPYQDSGEVAPLKVPEGVDAPNTRSALKIPEVKGESRPRPKDRCLDEPPDYAVARPAPAPAPAPPQG